MRPYLWLIFYALICCLAIFAGAYLFEEEGYVLLSYGKYYVEATIIGFILGLLLLWLLLRLSIGLVKRIFHAKRTATAFFSSKKSAKADQAFKQGITAFLQQDWATAEKLLAGAPGKGELAQSRHLVAAVAADAMGEQNRAFEHLVALEEGNKTSDIDSSLIKAELLTKQQAFDEATQVLEPLLKKKPKNPAILASYIKLLQAQHHWPALLVLLPRVEKLAVFDEQQQAAFSLLVLNNVLTVTAKGESVAAVEAQWKKLPGKLKKRDDAIAVYIGILASHGHGEKAETLLLKTLKKAPLEHFLNLFQQGCFSHSIKLSGYLQAELKKDEQNPQFLAALGYLALASEDDALAIKTLGKVYQTHPELVDLWSLADAYARLGEKSQAVAIYQKLKP